MSKVASAASDPGSGSWFEVAEEGYNPTTKIWGTVWAHSATVLHLQIGNVIYINIPKHLLTGIGLSQH